MIAFITAYSEEAHAETESRSVFGRGWRERGRNGEGPFNGHQVLLVEMFELDTGNDSRTL